MTFTWLCVEIDLYGFSVVDAFGAYCAQQSWILRRVPRLRGDLALVSKMVDFIERGGFRP